MVEPVEELIIDVPEDHQGVVIAQVGDPLPIGAKSAVYKPELAKRAPNASSRSERSSAPRR